MKKINSFLSFGLLFVLLAALPGCQLVADIFSAGFWVGIIIAILVIALIIWLIVKGMKWLGK